MGEGVLIAREDTTVLVETAAKLMQTKQAKVLNLWRVQALLGWV